ERDPGEAQRLVAAPQLEARQPQQRGLVGERLLVHDDRDLDAAALGGDAPADEQRGRDERQRQRQPQGPPPSAAHVAPAAGSGPPAAPPPGPPPAPARTPPMRALTLPPR